MSENVSSCQVMQMATELVGVARGGELDAKVGNLILARDSLLEEDESRTLSIAMGQNVGFVHAKGDSVDACPSFDLDRFLLKDIIDLLW